jgi:hypothetical protein
MWGIPTLNQRRDDLVAGMQITPDNLTVRLLLIGTFPDFIRARPPLVLRLSSAWSGVPSTYPVI